MGSVTLVIASSEEIDQADLDRTREEFEITRIFRMNSDPISNIKSRIEFELNPSFLNTHFSSVSESDREAMIQMTQEHDVVWIHSLNTANAFRINQWPHTVLDIDDIPSRDYRMSLIWRRRERLLSDRFSSISVCSENDRQYLGRNPLIHVIPNGFDLPLQMTNHIPTLPTRFGFIGLFTYEPNRTGIEWFIRNVWPRIKSEAPNARLRLIGRGSNEGYPLMGSDIDGLGYVEDASNEIATWTAMIVPIQVGGGTRIKIGEAFSKKCPVVSTTLGAFGYEVHNEEELMLADDEESFGKACIRVMNDPYLAKQLSENAWKRFLQEWTWDAIGASVEKAVQSCLDPVVALKAEENTKLNDDYIGNR
jgi:glycosyltransferase involved in cell wall biosynthesis